MARDHLLGYITAYIFLRLLWEFRWLLVAVMVLDHLVLAADDHSLPETGEKYFGICSHICLALVYHPFLEHLTHIALESLVEAFSALEDERHQSPSPFSRSALFSLWEPMADWWRTSNRRKANLVRTYRRYKWARQEDESEFIEFLKERGLFADLSCPITKEVFTTPVVASDGFTYEAKAITTWLEKFSHMSPMTGLPFESLELRINKSLVSLLESTRDRFLKMREEQGRPCEVPTDNILRASSRGFSRFVASVRESLSSTEIPMIVRPIRISSARSPSSRHPS